MDNPFRVSGYDEHPPSNAATHDAAASNNGFGYDQATAAVVPQPAAANGARYPATARWNGSAPEEQQKLPGYDAGVQQQVNVGATAPSPFASKQLPPAEDLEDEDEDDDDDDDDAREEDIDMDEEDDNSEQEEEDQLGATESPVQSEGMEASPADPTTATQAQPSAMEVEDMAEDDDASRMEEEVDEEDDEDSKASGDAAGNDDHFETQRHDEETTSAPQNETHEPTTDTTPKPATADLAVPAPDSPESERDKSASAATSPARKVRGKVLRLKKRPPTLKRLLSDSIAVHIPLSVTADLGIAIKRTREKRVAALYKRFPALQAATEKKDEAEDQEAVDEDGEGGTAKVEKRDKRPKLSHVPQRNEYASIMDYLEAKYVQGVMIGDEAVDDEEGQGSVYSETSFLDDSGLQRNVAEQVMGQATTTKLELQDDDAFFVNVGELEVEESELTKQNYDPLQDLKNDAKKTRKRKKPTSEVKQNGAATKKPPPKQTQKKKAAPKQDEPAKKKTKTKSSNDKKPPKATTKVDQPKPDAKPPPKPDDPATENLRNAAVKLQVRSDELLEELIQEVQGFTVDQLPAREKPAKLRVVISVPEGKKAGDVIKFANPHNKSQKVQTKIPAGTGPGETFKVLVSKPAPEPVESDNTDHNNIPREFYGLLDEFARSFDEWCDAEGAYRKAIKDKDFSAHLTKRKKFDKLIPAFPTGLKTPIDKAYLQRILRRARQSKQKRAQTVARLQQASEPTTLTKKELTIAFKPAEDTADAPDSGQSDDNASDTEAQETKQSQRPVWTNAIPKRTRHFGTKHFDHGLFEVETNS